MDQWTKEEESFLNGLNNIKKDWKCYRSKTHFLVNQSLDDDDDDDEDDEDDDYKKNNTHDSKLE